MAKGSGTTRASGSRNPSGISSQKGEAISARDDRELAYERMMKASGGSIMKGTVTDGIGTYYELGGRNYTLMSSSLDKIPTPGYRESSRFLVASALTDNVAVFNIDTQGIGNGQMSVNIGNEKHYVFYGNPSSNDRVDSRNADSITRASGRDDAWKILKRKYKEGLY